MLSSYTFIFLIILDQLPNDNFTIYTLAKFNIFAGKFIDIIMVIPTRI